MSEATFRKGEAPDGGESTTADLHWPNDRPELLPFLPLVYVAWSDGVLSEGDLARIAERTLRHEWLDDDARALLAAWLDSTAPPSPSALESLRARIRRLGTEPTGEARRSLVSLGIEMARAEGAAGRSWNEPGAVRSLEALEAELGVVGHEAVREIMGKEVAPPTGELAPPAGLRALQAFLDRPHADLRRQVLTLLRDPRFRLGHDLRVQEYRERARAALGVLAEQGWGGLAFPVETGGAADPGKALVVFESLAFGDLSVLVKYGVQFGLFGGSIVQLGTARHHRRYLPAVARLELAGCYAMTETGHGSNVRDLETVARYERHSDSFVVHTPTPRARKDWIGGAAHDARLAVVFAQTHVEGEQHGVHAFLVPLRDERGRPLAGIHLEDCGVKEGLNGVDNGRIAFDQVRIPRENLLDRFATVDEKGRYSSPILGADRRFFTMLGTLVAGRISVAAASVSAAKTGLTIAVRHAARRIQFGPAGGPEVPLLHYLALQRLLLPALAATYAHHFAVRRLVQEYVDSLAPDAPADRTREVEARAAGLKALATQHCVRTLHACREACGGQGYLAANRFGRLITDTDVFTTFEGANAVLLQLVAKALLSEYREEMGDMRLWDVVRLVADRAQTRLAELNPIVTRRTDAEHLRDPEFQAAAFRYREERLLSSSARRLKSLIDQGADTFEAMNACQDHLLMLGSAHAERLTVEAFQQAVVRAPNPAVSETLRTLADLHALSRLEAERAWYLESGYFEGNKARAIRAVVNDLCREVAAQALPLVDAFGIPDEVLEAPAGVARAQ